MLRLDFFCLLPYNQKAYNDRKKGNTFYKGSRHDHVGADITK